MTQILTRDQALEAVEDMLSDDITHERECNQCGSYFDEQIDLCLEIACHLIL